MGKLDGVDEGRQVAHPIRLPLLEIVVVEDADELRLERLDLRLHARQRRGRGIGHRRVHVLVELGAVAAERVDQHVCADELVLGHLDRRERVLLVASVSNGAASSTRTVSSAVIAAVELHALEGHGPRAAGADRHRLRLGERGRAEHQRQRRGRSGIGVELVDVRDDVDRSRRERLLRRVHGRDDEIGAELRDPVATQDPRPRRLQLADVQLHSTAVPRSSGPRSIVATAAAGIDGLQVDDPVRSFSVSTPLVRSAGSGRARTRRTPERAAVGTAGTVIVRSPPAGPVSAVSCSTSSPSAAAAGPPSSECDEDASSRGSQTWLPSEISPASPAPLVG